MADDLPGPAGAGRAAGPHRRSFRRPRRDGVVVLTKQPGRGPQAVLVDHLRPAVGAGLALDVGEDLGVRPAVRAGLDAQDPR
ncbi:hypothetical protein [Actinopolymorpha pittospori]